VGRKTLDNRFGGAKRDNLAVEHRCIIPDHASRCFATPPQRAVPWPAIRVFCHSAAEWRQDVAMLVSLRKVGNQSPQAQRGETSRTLILNSRSLLMHEMTTQIHRKALPPALPLSRNATPCNSLGCQSEVTSWNVIAKSQRDGMCHHANRRIIRNGFL
jgi:hypothetical protein